MNIIELAQQTKTLAEKATPNRGVPNVKFGRFVAAYHVHACTAAPQLADAVIECVEGLKKLASQKTPEELDEEGTMEDAEFDVGYEAMVLGVRALLTKYGITREGGE